MDIGAAVRQRILNLCKENGITVNKLSYLCGLTQSTLNNITGGRNKSLTVSTLKKICDGLNITIQDFFNDPLFFNLEQELFLGVFFCVQKKRPQAKCLRLFVSRKSEVGSPVAGRRYPLLLAGLYPTVPGRFAAMAAENAAHAGLPTAD